jgi:hypothetical protein
MDFTINVYKNLLLRLQNQGFAFQTFSGFTSNPENKTIVLRHDVDLRPKNSLCFAQIQAELGIKGSYYFRAVPESWDESIIHEIARLGHEIGYHYESLTTCNADIDSAYIDFCKNLELLRKIAPVNTICMHGSPKSSFDSKDLWKKYSYKSLEIIGEPYFDVDFSNVFYLTDTGRRWDGYKVSVRDRIPIHQERWNKEGLSFHSTNDIITKIQLLPTQIMITMHPQRWNSQFGAWIKEYVFQNLKNSIKYFMIALKK